MLWRVSHVKSSWHVSVSFFSFLDTVRTSVYILCLYMSCSISSSLLWNIWRILRFFCIFIHFIILTYPVYLKKSLDSLFFRKPPREVNKNNIKLNVSKIFNALKSFSREELLTRQRFIFFLPWHRPDFCIYSLLIYVM
jgi:hypothetical protein